MKAVKTKCFDTAGWATGIIQLVQNCTKRSTNHKVHFSDTLAIL